MFVVLKAPLNKPAETVPVAVISLATSVPVIESPCEEALPLNMTNNNAIASTCLYFAIKLFLKHLVLDISFIPRG